MSTLQQAPGFSLATTTIQNTHTKEQKHTFFFSTALKFRIYLKLLPKDGSNALAKGANALLQPAQHRHQHKHIIRHKHSQRVSINLWSTSQYSSLRHTLDEANAHFFFRVAVNAADLCVCKICVIFADAGVETVWGNRTLRKLDSKKNHNGKKAALHDTCILQCNKIRADQSLLCKKTTNSSAEINKSVHPKCTQVVVKSSAYWTATNGWVRLFVYE